jgi:hypothetical protein
MSETHATTEGQSESRLYEIRLKGHLDGRWAGWFGSMSITLEDNGDTLLTGPVVDQAALHGLLKKVRDLGVPLLSVNRAERGPSTMLPSRNLILFQKKENKMQDLQKMGGVAALIHAAAYVVGIVLGVTLIFPLLNSDPDQYIAFLTDNQTLMHMWNLISYWGSAIALVILVYALYERLKVGSPALMQTAAIFGLIWAGLVIGSGNLMIHDLGMVSDLYGQDPVQAETVWLALDAMETGIVSGNELVGSLWVLLLSLAALRTGGLPRTLNYLGVAICVPGILSVFPGLGEIAFIFGLGMVVWSVWAGIVMLRGNA